MAEKIGEDGIDYGDTGFINDYNNYQIYLDLIGIKYSHKEILESMKLSEEQLTELINQFELIEEED